MTQIAINTLAFHGYRLDTALEQIARLSDDVEPVFIARYDPSLREEYFNEGNARMLCGRLEELGLKVRAMGSHMDMGGADSVAVFRRRMDFAGAIGAKTILTNATHASRQAAFYKNMEKLAGHAERLGLTIALENPGDGQDLLLGCGIEGTTVVQTIGSDRVRLNYDFSNIFTYSRGKRLPEQELAAVLPSIGHLHLKNVKHQDGGWMVCGIDEGTIDYSGLFRRFPALLSIPMSIELPLRFGYDTQFDFVLRETLALPLERLERVLSRSLEYLNTMVAELNRDVRKANQAKLKGD